MSRGPLLGMLSLGALLVGVASPLRGQDAAFDVAVVRPNTSDATERSIQLLPNGRFAARNETLRTVILRAYKLHGSQLIDAPDWTDRDRFDIEGRTEPPPRQGPEGLLPMVRTLLADRFALRTRRDTRPLPAYVLTFARRDRGLGPSINPTKADCSGETVLSQDEIRASVRDGWPPCGMTFVVQFTTKTDKGTASQMRFRRSATTIDDLGFALQGAVDRPVVNRTGLEGLYDVEYSYSPRPADTGVTSAFGPEAPGVFAAVEEQLGLKLEAERTDVPVVVIESVQRPTEN